MYKDDWEACGGKVKLRFMRNDVLDARTKPRYRSLRCEESVGGALLDNTRCRIFATDATLREFDTLVVNSGAHPRPAAEFGREMEASAKALTSSMKRLHGEDKAILVVRNTVPGHWGCTERWEPEEEGAWSCEHLVFSEAPSPVPCRMRDRLSTRHSILAPEVDYSRNHEELIWRMKGLWLVVLFFIDLK